MVKVIIPLGLMFTIILLKRIPKIGGKTSVALAAAGISALLLGGIYNPLEWLGAWLNGIDRIAWVIGLSVFGSIYSETQTEVGALETVLNMLRAKFGQSPRGLIVVIMITLAIAGSMLGDAIASATVVGVLTIGAMAALGLPGEKITGIIVIGAALGSIMPPITQAVFLSASFLDIDPSWAVQPAYITVAIGIVFNCWFVARFYIKKDMALPDDLIIEKSAGKIFRERWVSLIPLFVLIFCIICRSIPGGQADFISGVLNTFQVQGQPFLKWLGGVPILKMFSNTIIISIILATIVAFCFKGMRGKGARCLKIGLKNIKGATITQICIGLMLGGFYAGGTIEAIQEFAQDMGHHSLIWGGGLAMVVMGMLTGAQSAGQSAIFVFLGPTLVSMGFNPVNTAIFGSHLASAGQCMLPVNLMCFVVAGLVSGQTGQEVNPIKSMVYCLCCGIYLLLAGMVMIYLPAWPVAAPM